ncbi:hypothetical protein EJ08DRAFT_315286 [Tothia fuscella]|uniref:Uncharacterized protein n=1 Tax=Tothia fuscella TaxID=1048955 RepID=A0A9P4NPF7_9PEZI|nr:hypothetical protein EJ08DRAFT_315286 [Tothia fuscella]
MASQTKDSTIEPDQPSIQNNVFRAEIYNASRARENDIFNPPPAYPSNIHTIHSSSTRQDNRMCPNARTCWPGITLEAFSPFNCHGDTPKLMRRLCMSGVLAIRTGISILGIFYNAYGHGIGGFIVSIILTVIGFFFVAWCLKEIGNLTGQRKVLGHLFGRWHYDIFLLFNLVVHIALLNGVFFRMPGAAYSSLWIVMWLAMFGAAWIATWPPENDGSVVQTVLVVHR